MVYGLLDANIPRQYDSAVCSNMEGDRKMINGEKIIAILKPRKDQIRIYGNWVEIEIQKLGINFSCELDWWNTECNTTKNDLGVDAILRQAVIDELKRYFHDEYYQRTSIQDCRDCFIEDVLNHLPSVTPQEPRKGHWIYDYTSADGHRTYHCSECGCYLQPKHSEPLNSFKWCSLCGADMSEVEE